MEVGGGCGPGVAVVGGSGWAGAVRGPVTAPVDAQRAAGNAEKLLTSCPQA